MLLIYIIIQGLLLNVKDSLKILEAFLYDFYYIS